MSKNSDKIKKAYETLQGEGMLTGKQVETLRTKLIDVDQKLQAGTAAYDDAARINMTREEASGLHAQRHKDVLNGGTQTAEDVMHGLMDRTGGAAQRIQDVATHALDAMTNPKNAARLPAVHAAIYSLTKDEQVEVYQQLQETLPMLTGNPLAFDAAMGDNMKPLQAVDPDVAGGAARNGAGAIYYLASKIPRRDPSLYGKNRPPSRSQLNSTMQTFVAVMDPVAVAYSAIQGRVTKEMVDAVRNTNPATYAELSVALSEVLEKTDVSTASRKTLGGINAFLGGWTPSTRAVPSSNYSLTMRRTVRRLELRVADVP